jgi:hypothetical protein
MDAIDAAYFSYTLWGTVFVLADIATGVALFRLGLTSRDAIGRHVLDM